MITKALHHWIYLSNGCWWMMKNQIIEQEADKSKWSVCMYVIKTGGRAWRKSEAQQKMCRRTQDVSPFACKQQNFGEVWLPVELGSTSFTRLSGITPCPSPRTTFPFLLNASFLPSSVSVSLYCPSMTRDSMVRLLFALVCAGCPAKQVIALFLLQPFP